MSSPIYLEDSCGFQLKALHFPNWFGLSLSICSVFLFDVIMSRKRTFCSILMEFELVLFFLLFFSGRNLFGCYVDVRDTIFVNFLSLCRFSGMDF